MKTGAFGNAEAALACIIVQIPGRQSKPSTADHNTGRTGSLQEVRWRVHRR